MEVVPRKKIGAMKIGEIMLEDRKAALNAVLGSKEFSRAPALAKLLKYLCEKNFEGRVHEIKEFSIATDVYGRSDNFGEKRDSVVRVEMSRLRKRLVNYYADEGTEQALRIVIPPGTYAPEFEPQTPGVAIPADLPPSPPSPRSKQGHTTAIAASILLVAAVALIVFRAPRPITTPASQVQTPLDHDPGVAVGVRHTVRILAGSSTDRSVDRFGVEWAGDRYFVGGSKITGNSAERRWGYPPAPSA